MSSRKYYACTHILGLKSFSDRNSVAFAPGFLHMGILGRRRRGRPGHISLNISYRVMIHVRPLLSPVGTKVHLGRDDERHLLREG